jgi:hypothetical protein
MSGAARKLVFLGWFLFGMTLLLCGILVALSPLSEAMRANGELQEYLSLLGIGLTTFSLAGGACLGASRMMIVGTALLSWFLWVRPAEQRMAVVYTEQLRQQAAVHTYIEWVTAWMLADIGGALSGEKINWPSLRAHTHQFWETLDVSARTVLVQFLTEAGLLVSVALPPEEIVACTCELS